MRLYLIRHADALPAGQNGIETDEARPLSTKGKQQCQALAGALHRAGVRFDLVLTSPLVRAQQTTEELFRHWQGPQPERQDCAPLASGERLKGLAEVVRALKQEAVALVGHEPDLSNLAVWLMGSRKARLDMAKAGVAALDCTDEPGKGDATLVWLVTPDWYAAVP